MKTTSLRAVKLGMSGFSGDDCGAGDLENTHRIRWIEVPPAQDVGDRILIADWHERREEVVR